jgi:tetratricopeptide (TPR) repeat protein
VFYVAHEGRTYVKERFFRLPMSERWYGPTHECFSAYKVGSAILAGVTFSELPKTPGELRRKFERDVEVLERHTREHPKEPRWHYYLGESHGNLGQLALAIAAYDRCAALRGWDEESAWACFRAAECLCKLDRFEEALDRCVAGLARHAGIAELAWLAGYACYRLNRDAQAVYWARLAITHGLFQGDGSSIPRIGFRHPSALWEEPYDVIRWAERRRGNSSAAQEAERLWAEAKAARERASS